MTYKQILKLIALKKYKGNTGVIQEIVYQQMFANPALPSLLDLSVFLGTTPRTLQRRLQDEGIDFKQICREIQRLKVCYYVSQPFIAEMRMKDVTPLLGYSDYSSLLNFTRNTFNLSWRELVNTVSGQEIPLPWEIDVDALELGALHTDLIIQNLIRDSEKAVKYLEKVKSKKPKIRKVENIIKQLNKLIEI